MPSELRQGDLSLREKLAAALQGDSKPGSIRERLVHGIVGGTGRQDGMPLADFSPMGIVFAGDEGSRALNAGKYGDAAGAMAGLVPGARGAGAMAKEIVENLSTHAPKVLEDTLSQLGSIGVKGSDPAEVISKAFYGHELQDMLKQSRELKAKGAQASYEQSRLPKLDRAPSMRQSLERNANLSKEIGKIEDRAQRKTKGEYAPGTRFEGVDDEEFDDAITPAMILQRDIESGHKPATLHPSNEGAGSHPEEFVADKLNRGDETTLQRLYGKDPEKLHFIKNAMQDEGGNVPEDVLMTLMDHAQQTGKTSQLAEALGHGEGTYAHSDPEALKSVISESQLSIPEMLSMHYDLDPEKFKGVYGPAGMTRSKGKPTQ